MFNTDECNVGKHEMDTRTDTFVAGANFLACKFNWTTCEVIPFSSEYEATTKGIPIVSATTAWTNEQTGEMVILYFHQILWYGKRMQQSLLNPNQLRHYGQSVCDDVTDKNRAFGIEINDEVVISFQMSGTTIFFDSRVPSRWEMDNCQVFMMTHDSTWHLTMVQIASVTPVHPLHTLATLRANRNSPKLTEPDDALLSMPDVYDDYTFLSRVVSAVHIHDV
jgi:hypothetical protein